MLENFARKVLDEIDASRSELIELLKDLVRTPTVNPPGENYSECVRLLSEKFKQVGLDVQVVDVPQNQLRDSGLELPRPSVLGRLKGEQGKPVLHINGHYDVVPVGSGWTVDPFAAEVRQGRLYGRGSTDMKGGITAAVMAALTLARFEANLQGDLVISVTPDEETGGQLGAGFLVANGFAQANATIVAEGSDVNSLTIAHKGALWMELRTIGKAAHGSRPNQGVNAVTKMAEVVLSLDQFAEELKAQRTPSSELFQEFPSPSLMCGGTIHGGMKTNVVPDSCALTLDRRLLPEETIDDAQQQILSRIEKIKSDDPELKVEAKRLLGIAAYQCPENASIMAALSEAITNVNGTKPTIVGTTGFTDAHYFGAEMPTAMYGCSVREKAHQADEYVTIDDVVKAAKVYALTAIKMLQ